MLPFTKRPGRGDDGNDVITKDDLVDSPSYRGESRIPGSKRSLAPPSRPLAESVGDDEMTRLLDTSGLSGAFPPAGRLPTGLGPALPAPVPPPARSRTAPPPSIRPSQRALLDEDDDEDDDGRTVVRESPRILKRPSAKNMSPLTSPTSISPTAVIQSTLESARAHRRENLMPGPPRDLLEDEADFGDFRPVGGDLRSRTRPMDGAPGHRPVTGFPPPVSSRPHLAYAEHAVAPPPPGSHRAGEGYGLTPAPVSNVPVPMSSVPAHFMTVHARPEDPPGTAVTSRHRVAGRPAMSWAAAMLACGLLVGVGAVAVVQGNESAAETTAAFVDPSRAAAQVTAPPDVEPPSAALPGAKEGSPASAPTSAVLMGTAPVAPPANVIGASPPPVAPPADEIADPPAEAADPMAEAADPPADPPEETTVAVAAVKTPAASPQPARKPTPAAAPARTPRTPVKVATPKPVAKPQPPPRRRVTPPPPSDTEEETRKALEALQKAQLESASSFGGDD